MQIIIYASKNKKTQNLHRKIEEESLMPVVEIHIAELAKKQIDEAESVYIEWCARDYVINKFWDALNKKRVSFYNESFVSDIDDYEEINLKLRKAIKEKNWKLCKGINEFLEYGDLIRKRTKLRCLPSKIQIESTDICNARCIMCSHAYQQGGGIDLFESGVIEKLQVLFPYVKEVVLHGNGEPFISNKLVDYLKMLSDYDIQFIANTNLSIVSYDLVKIFNNSFIELNISCDGHTKELYESIRCGLSFNVFIENVKQVRKKCPTLYMKMDTVVMRQNIWSLEEIVIFAAELGFNEVVFNMLCVDKRNNNLEDSPLNYLSDYLTNIKQAVKRGICLGIKVTYFDLCIDNTNNESGENKDVSGICDWLVNGAYVDLKGQIGLCCINQNKTMGNLHYCSFDQIWNGEKYQAIRTQFYNGVMPDYCCGCDFIMQERLKYIISYDKSRKIINKQEREIHTNE